MTPENGCLEFGVRPHSSHSSHSPAKRLTGLLPTVEGRGVIETDAAQELEWTPAVMKKGDVLVFDSHAPHRSGPNKSRLPRRALYLTYNRAAKGDWRDTYYSNKRQVSVSPKSTSEWKGA